MTAIGLNVSVLKALVVEGCHTARTVHVIDLMHFNFWE